MKDWRSWREALLELIFPEVKLCLFCWKAIEGDGGHSLCENCTAVLKLSARLSAPAAGILRLKLTARLLRRSCLTWVWGVIPTMGCTGDDGPEIGGRGTGAGAVIDGGKVKPEGLPRRNGLICLFPASGAERERGYRACCWHGKSAGSWA